MIRNLLLVTGFFLLACGLSGLLQGIDAKNLEDAIFGGILIAGSALTFAFGSRRGKMSTLER